MKRFTQLYVDLDQTNQTSKKLSLLKKYFAETPAADASWALYFLSGERLKRLIPSRQLREWAVEASGIPAWLMEECYDSVGDLAETMALLLPSHGPGTSLALHQIIEERLKPLATLPDAERRTSLIQTWSELTLDEKFVWNKIITGEFRVGVSKTLVVRALAEVTGVTPGVMAHRFMGSWRPTVAAYDSLRSAEDSVPDIARPYPFFLAYPLDSAAENLGPASDWQAEWKWDGIRGQILRRQGQVSVWSRGEELVSERFPEIQKSAFDLPDGTVIDGEILGWKDGRPLPFGYLQHRLGRKKVSASLMSNYPVVFMVFDILELAGQDLRLQPLSARRAQLETLLKSLPTDSVFKMSPVLQASEWSTLATHFNRARQEAVEGVMLKRLSSPYRVGRQKGDWWKWKTDPYHIDAVLIYAQQGHGRRASLFTDYTFGLWKDGKLVPVAKAYSGLSDEEIRRVDAFVRRNTLDRFGPVRVVKPELVFELAFEGIQASSRHKAGVAVRFPRMSRWREDKKADEADQLDTLKALANAASVAA